MTDTMTMTRERALPERSAPLLVQAFFAGRNPRTLRAYERDLEDFRAFTGVHSIEHAADLLLANGHGNANALAFAYRAHLLDRKLSPATINRRLAALRSLVTLARTLGYVVWELEVPGVKSQPYRDTRGPGREGFSRLLAALRARTDTKAIRDRAILRLLYDLGLRRGEIVSLDVEHLDLDAAQLHVLGKGRTERVALTLPPETCAALSAWLAEREAIAGPHGPLFVNADRAGKGGRLTGTSIYRLVRKLGESVAVKARPHGLRHAAITEALDLTQGDYRAVAKFSRHADLRTLYRYDDNREDKAGAIAKLIASHTPPD